jgi:uncharacterized protein (TIGR02271 family)
VVTSKSVKPVRGVGSRNASATPAPALASTKEDVLRLPVIEESLQIRKEVVDQGGVKVSKRVETREQLVDELLRSEHVEIERRPINTAIADDAVPGVRQEGDTLIVPVIEEVLISVKRLVLVEEVRITRTQKTHHKQQTFSLRKEQIEVERLAAEPSTVKAS